MGKLVDGRSDIYARRRRAVRGARRLPAVRRRRRVLGRLQARARDAGARRPRSTRACRRALSAIVMRCLAKSAADALRSAASSSPTRCIAFLARARPTPRRASARRSLRARRVSARRSAHEARARHRRSSTRRIRSSSRAAARASTALVRVRVIDDDGVEGWGEAAPSRFYGETADTVLGALARARADASRARDRVVARGDRARDDNARSASTASAKSAVSAALHDLAAKRLGVPLYRMWGLDPASAPPSSFTIAHRRRRRRAARARATRRRSIRCSRSSSARTATSRSSRVVRETAPTKMLRVDANAAWTPKHALRMIDVLRGAAASSSSSSRCRRTTSTGCASCASARRCRSSPTRSCVVVDRHPAARRRGGRHQHQAREVRRAARSAAHDRDRARARHARDGRLHDRDEPRHHGGRALRAAARLRGFRRRGAAVGRSVRRRDDRRRRDHAAGRAGAGRYAVARWRDVRTQRPG